MLYQCSEGGTLTIPTKFFFFLSNHELNCRCLESGVRGVVDPFTDSYLINGEQEDADEVEEDDQEEDESPDVDYSMIGLDED